MGNIIQHYAFNDISKYLYSMKLNTSIDELNSIQTEERKGSCSIVSDIAATVEISDIAKSKYASSTETPKQRTSDPVNETPGKQEEVKIQDNTDEDTWMSSVEREVKELEDYIANHPVDTSINLLEKGRLSEMVVKGSAKVVDDALIEAEDKYKEAFASAAEGFADFSEKITYGNYRSNDVSVDNLNLDAIDKMEQTYQSYKDQIQKNYKGDEGAKYLNKLDEVYNSVFAEKIIKPVKEAYDDKFVFFRPDSEESMRSIKATSTNQESLEQMISGYLANQSIKEKQHGVLSDGTRSFYDMAKDTSMWHDSDAIKSVLKDTMKVYSSVKDLKAGSSEYKFFKAQADAIAKKISDQYGKNLEYRMDKIGLNKDGIDVELDENTKKNINDYITTSSPGKFMIDFSEISDLSLLKSNY